MSAPRLLDDGSARLPEGFRRWRWHRPQTRARAIQWTPATGQTRYAWARSRTPSRQRPYFEHLARLCRRRPLALMPPELVAAASTAAPEDRAAFREEVSSYLIRSSDPEGEWVFTLSAVTWRGATCDRLAVRCSDGRTMPDWELVLRFRAWALPDDREAFAWLPDQGGDDPPERYRNDPPNEFVLVSPRPSDA